MSSIWRGYGSAIFLEFGQLSSTRGGDSTKGNPVGEFTIMFEWSWRIESQTAILTGSSSDEKEWETIFKSIIGQTVSDITLFGRLPELSITLSGDRYLVSFITADGQPAWTLFRRGDDDTNFPAISVADGVIVTIA
ncbi:hypothetical protein JAU75_17515 [Ochrobactrum sp. Q0168]|uniref:hypothetical protein n=1 Tax=Ochrobactrum sp. Q0168 TaxID=2793241 RepID=UPI0018EA7AFE|nr:hypothetical protein [Ochrobactrum sp. Q0168]